MSRLVVVLAVVVPVTAIALVVTAIVASEDPASPAAAVTTTATPPETTTSTAPSSTDVNEQIFVQANAVIAAPTTDNISNLALAMAQSGEVGWVPYLIDMWRFFGAGETAPPIAFALTTLTGEPLPDDIGTVYNFYGRWLHREEPLPYDVQGDGSGYVAWKSLLYSWVDIAFVELITQIDDPILASQIQWGGVLRGGIPELNDPATLTVDEAVWMVPEELTFGAVINGEVRAYPHRILDHHEMANDTLGGEPVALANCTLCRTGILFSRRVSDQVLTFQSSGFLWSSNKVMVDVETDTLWNQLTGEGVAGALKGTVLDRFPITVTTYGEWIEEHPDTDVLDIPDAGYSYEPGDAYAEYYASPNVVWPAVDVPDAFAEKDLVATLDLGGAQLAVGVEALDGAGPQAFNIGGQQVVVVSTDGGARFYGGSGGGDVLDLVVEDAGEERLVLADGTEFERLQSGHSFWFAWYANFPDTEWWPG